MERLHLQDIIQDMEDNFNIQKFFKDQYLTEAEAIPTEPGIPGERASNHDRKMAMRNVLDVLGKLYPELSIDDRLDFLRTHKDDFFNGTVDPYKENEIRNEYEEYFALNNVGL